MGNPGSEERSQKAMCCAEARGAFSKLWVFFCSGPQGVEARRAPKITPFSSKALVIKVFLKTSFGPTFLRLVMLEGLILIFPTKG